MFDKLLNNSEAYDYLFGQHGMDLAKIDYIVAMINQKAAENVDNPEKIEILTEVLNDIKLVLTDGESQEVH